MAPSSLLRPFSRFLHTTSCARVVPSASSLPPRQNDPVATEFREQLKDELTTFIDGIAQNPHDFNKPEPIPQKVRFNEQTVVRPIDFQRDRHQMPPRRKGATIGPGREARYSDVFLQLGIDPRKEADNEALMSAYATQLGRIMPRSETKLSQRSQRLLGKAIKRAKMMGVIPMLSNSKKESRFINRHALPTPSLPPPSSERKDSKS